MDTFLAIVLYGPAIFVLVVSVAMQIFGGRR